MITLNKGGSYDKESGYKFTPKYDVTKLVYTAAPSTGAYDLIVEHCAIAASIAASPITAKPINWGLIGGVIGGVTLVGGTALVVIKRKSVSSQIRKALGGKV